jgi:hypothetical protein
MRDTYISLVQKLAPLHLGAPLVLSFGSSFKVLLDVEEATSVLDREEQQELMQQQNTAINNLNEKSVFLKAYRKAKHERSEASAKVAKALKDSLSGLATALPLLISHANVKKLIPPGAVIWRGNLRGEWWARFKPYTSFHEKLTNHENETEAAKEVIKKLWEQWAEREGVVAKDTCPIVGLF